MKRIVLMILSFVLLFCVMCSCDNMNEQGHQPLSEEMEEQTDLTGEKDTSINPIKESPVSDFEYEFSSDRKAVYITKYIGTSDHVVIPSTIENLPVKTLKGTFNEGTISNGVFENSNVKTVVVPNSVTGIGMCAFRNCNELTEVIISNQCDQLLDAAFQNCLKLESIDLSKTKISLIGTNAFDGCTKLSEIKFPISLLTISTRAFYNCSGLLEIRLPQNLVKIEKEAFYNCTSLELITIPTNLEMMASDSMRFYNMPSLKKIFFDEGRETVTGYAFFDIITDAEIVIPKSVKKFTSYPFFAHGTVKFVFLGNCPEIVEKTDFYGNPTIYYNPDMAGWENCLWKNQYALFPIQ